MNISFFFSSTQRMRSQLLWLYPSRHYSLKLQVTKTSWYLQWASGIGSAQSGPIFCLIVRHIGLVYLFSAKVAEWVHKLNFSAPRMVCCCFIWNSYHLHFATSKCTCSTGQLAVRGFSFIYSPVCFVLDCFLFHVSLSWCHLWIAIYASVRTLLKVELWNLGARWCMPSSAC